MLKEKISQMVDQVIYHPVNRGKGAFFGVEPEITAKLEWGVGSTRCTFPTAVGVMQKAKGQLERRRKRQLRDNEIQSATTPWY